MIKGLHKSLTTMLLVLAVAITAVFSTAKATEVKADETEVKYHDVVVDVTYDQTEARNLFTLINEFRNSEDAWFWTGDDETATKYYPQDLKDFKYDYALEKVAMQRAAEIAIYFAHFRPQGGSLDEACIDVGFDRRILWAENIAVGRTSAETALLAFREDKYMYSGQPHRRTMLGGYPAIGIGHVKLNDVNYWVIDYGLISEEEPESEPFNDTIEITIPMNDNYVKSVSAYIDFTLTEGEAVSLDKIIPVFQPTTGFWKTKTRGIPVKNPLTFISADNEYISINENEIIGLKAGTGTITASLFDREFTKEITVEAKPEPEPTPTPNPTPILAKVIVVPYHLEDDSIPTQNPTKTENHDTAVSPAAVTVVYPEDKQADTQNEIPDQTDVTNIPTQAEVTNIPTQATVTNIPTQAVVTNIPTQAVVTNIPTQATVTNIPTQAVVTNIPTQATVTNIPTQATVTNMPTQAVVTNIPTQAVVTNIPTQAVVTNIPSQDTTSQNSTSQGSSNQASSSMSDSGSTSDEDTNVEFSQNIEPKTYVNTNTDGSVTEIAYTKAKNHIEIAVKNTSLDNTSELTENYAGTKGNKITLTSAETTKKTYKVSKYIKVGKKKYYITTIGSQILKGNTTVTKLKIGSRVTTIEENAFKGNKKIKTIEITAKNLTTIKAGAFSNLRSKVKFIIKGSIEDCERVKQLIIDSGASKKTRFEFIES